MKIQKLARQEAQKIAAGEVVERPANIVKELVENSLDAGATAITISVKQGGKTHITITDNGCGMATDDAQICFERHTTSKIKTIDQLQDVTTFGFRGEALASICSIAKITITTKTADALEGLQLHLENGVIEKAKTVASQTGTTITIDDLFYNMPARKKFLKSTATEWNRITTLFKAFALDNCNVHFKLVHDDSVSYNCPPTKTISERIAQLFDAPLTNHVTELATFEQNDIVVSGAVTTQSYARYDRNGIFFFVNFRWVKNYQLTNALTKGYLNVLPSGRYPAAVVCLTVNPKTVDVNVHPKKEEIQFLNPRIVESVITAAVKTTLENHLSQQLKRTVNLAPTPEYTAPIPPPPFPIAPFPPTPQQKIKEPEEHKQEQPEEQKVPQPIEPVVEQKTLQQQGILIGQYKQTYLLLEKKDGLLFIDQHAAHERILYEKFKERFQDVAVVNLLFPITVQISADNMQLIEPHLDIFNQHGIIIEQLGPDQLAIKATPVFLKDQPVNDLVEQVICWVKELQQVDKQDFYKIVTEKLRAQMACKAAIKAGYSMTQETMEQLLADLETCDNRFTCPHGRPTTFLLPLNDLERKFKRKL